jgi:hypothetical protein
MKVAQRLSRASALAASSVSERMSSRVRASSSVHPSIQRSGPAPSSALPMIVAMSSPAVRAPTKPSGTTNGKTIVRLVSSANEVGAFMRQTATAATTAIVATAAATARQPRRDEATVDASIPGPRPLDGRRAVPVGRSSRIPGCLSAARNSAAPA